ncbi:hypothetical protein GCM10022214_52690 [Actinomadura miaoliensis]|uniref:Uncharacterized protein n=1 Tax=Actinomadura miaoliensis TaxID=430685 RepID=A0ABP7WCH2_9ACTN
MAPEKVVRYPINTPQTGRTERAAAPGIIAMTPGPAMDARPWTGRRVREGGAERAAPLLDVPVPAPRSQASSAGTSPRYGTVR